MAGTSPPQVDPGPETSPSSLLVLYHTSEKMQYLISKKYFISQRDFLPSSVYAQTRDLYSGNNPKLCTDVLNALYRKGKRVLNGYLVSLRYAVMTFKSHSSYGVHIVDHLATDGACLTGSKIAVISLVEGDTDFVRSFGLELLKSLLCFRYKCACHIDSPYSRKAFVPSDSHFLGFFFCPTYPASIGSVGFLIQEDQRFGSPAPPASARINSIYDYRAAFACSAIIIFAHNTFMNGNYLRLFNL